jgi:diguanylate cyclase (GGDEF)-like protein/PAS domain S-box-containing protein
MQMLNLGSLNPDPLSAVRQNPDMPKVVIDEFGIICAVAPDWVRTGAVNHALGGEPKIGQSFETLTKRLVKQAPTLAKEFCDKMSLCLSSNLQAFVFEYPFVSEVSVDWFLVTAQAFVDGGHRHIKLDYKDISAQRLSEVNERLQTKSIDFNLCGMVIAEAKSSEMHLIYVNPAAERITGYVAAEMVGRDCKFLQGLDRQQPALTGLRTGLDAKVVTTSLLRNYRKDGSLFTNEVSIFPVTNLGGEILYFVGVQRDLTTERIAKTAFHASREREKIGMRFANVGVFELDPATGAIQSQEYARELLGLAGDEDLTFDVLKATISAEDRDRFEEGFKSCMSGVSGIDLEYRVVWPDGNVKWLHTKGHIFERREGNGLRLVCMSQDVTQRRIVDRHIRYVAEHDALTGLPNRAVMRDRCEQVLSVAKRNNTCVGLLFIDLDNFKEVNDTHGHQIGDELLKEVALRLRSTVRAADTVCRQSGDEFVVILQELPNSTAIDYCVSKIRDALNAPYKFEGLQFVSTASIGISCSPADGTTTDELLRHADMAMYVAKRKGGGHYEFYSQAIGRTIHEIQSLRSELSLAIERDELVMFYQPQIHAAAGKLVGLEALVRWRHPERGLLMPEQFMQVAQTSGDLLFAIEEWCIHESVNQRAKWLQKGFLPGVPVHINLSEQYFQEQHLLSKLAAHLRGANLGPSQIGFEIPESAIWAEGVDAAHGISIVKGLDALGVTLTIDNFGHGISSVSQLAQCPIDGIKLDKAIMSRFSEDRSTLAAFSAILAMGKSLHLQVVAQSIEISQQARVASRLGCNTLQGNLFCSPVNAVELASYIGNANHRVSVGFQ